MANHPSPSKHFPEAPFPPEGFVFRPAGDQDGPALRALIFPILEHYGLAPDPAGIDADLTAVETHYRNQGGDFYLLESPQHGVVASVGLFNLGNGGVELRKMYLSATLRGRGIGRGIATFAINRARAMGFSRLQLETSPKLREALALYESLGFRRAARAGHHCRCEILMELPLG